MHNRLIEWGRSPDRGVVGVPIVIVGVAINAVWTTTLLVLTVRGLLWMI